MSNTESMKAAQRRFYYRHREQQIASSAAWNRAHPERHRETKRSYYHRHRDRLLAKHRLQLRQAKQRILDAYGNKCVCCGESTFEFLTIDHIFGGGNQERKQVGNGIQFYKYIESLGYPKDRYRLLCMNCNISYGFYKYCPHQKQEATGVTGT